MTNSPTRMPSGLPPTTIVCFPNMVSMPPSQHQSPASSFAGSTTINAIQSTSLSTSQMPSLSASPGLAGQANAGGAHIIQTQQIFGNIVQRSVSTSQDGLHRAAIVASSSSLPYVQLPSSQPMRTISQSAEQMASMRPKIPGKGGRGSRSNNNRPPPGAVNLERSYQICQAVIQNSPNRHQLKAQLRPPPSMLAVATTNSSSANSTAPTLKPTKRDEGISSTNKIVYKVNGTLNRLQRLQTNSILVL